MASISANGGDYVFISNVSSQTGERNTNNYSHVSSLVPSTLGLSQDDIISL